MLVDQTLTGLIMRYLFLLAIFIHSGASGAQSGQFCFAAAETYYEQVYCQLQAKAQLGGLPPFHQFKKNNEQVQFSLLKRPATRNAIKLPAPVRQTTAKTPLTLPSINESTGSGARQTNASVSEPERQSVRTQVLGQENRQACTLNSMYLECEGETYQLVGNRANHRLGPQALTAANHMALPDFTGGDVEDYLAGAYHTYIAKMREIGLGGVTMTYRKFAYLYQDLQSKGLNFSQRFETMYSFLKKDKATLAVSERVAIPIGLSTESCAPLGDNLRVCEFQGRNFIFER